VSPLDPPVYEGANLGNLSAELELRLTGSALLPGLSSDLASQIPEAETYILFIADGLGDHQLDHPKATALAESRVGVLRAPFPATTIVSLSTLFSGMAPAGHGVLSHFMHLPEQGGVTNMLKWKDRSGTPLTDDPASFLPAPNLWERLTGSGIEPVTVQPGPFADTPTTRMLYRGCRFEGVWNSNEIVEATLQLSEQPRRLVVAYMPQLDISAHGHGQQSSEYQTSLQQVADVWDRLVRHAPDHVTVIGTGDHGHLDYPPSAKHPVKSRPNAKVFGDPRALGLQMTDEAAEKLAAGLPATLVSDPRSYFGPGGHEALSERLPTHLLLADPGHLLLPRYMDDRLIGYHGGLDPREAEVPLLVG
jgi:hypothetical protein